MRQRDRDTLITSQLKDIQQEPTTLVLKMDNRLTKKKDFTGVVVGKNAELRIIGGTGGMPLEPYE